VTVTWRGGRRSHQQTKNCVEERRHARTHARTQRQGALAAAAGLKLTPQLLMLLLLL